MKPLVYAASIVGFMNEKCREFLNCKTLCNQVFGSNNK